MGMMDERNKTVAGMGSSGATGMMDGIESEPKSMSMGMMGDSSPKGMGMMGGSSPKGMGMMGGYNPHFGEGMYKEESHIKEYMLVGVVGFVLGLIVGKVLNKEG